MNRNRLLALGAVAAALVVWLGPWPRAAAATTAVGEHELFTVRRGDLPITLTENGTMVAKDAQKVQVQIRSESKIVWLVEEGKEVVAGDVVCRLDDAPAKKLVEEARLEILKSEQDLKTARTELEIQEVEAAAAERKAQIALEKTQKEREKYRDGEAPQARRKLEVALKDAETKFVRTKKKLEDSQELLKQNYIKKSEFEDNEIEFQSVTVQRDSALKELELFDKYTLPMTLTDHDTKVADAERELVTTKKRNESQHGQKEVAVQQVEKRLQAQQEQLKEREEDLANMVLKSPGPGLVVYGNPHEPWWRERIKVGNQVWNGNTLISVPDLRVMQVRLQIHEADISKLKTGLPATVTTDSHPGMLLRGEISRIASVANSNDEYGSSEVKKFAVEVTIDTKDLRIRPGVSAKVEIHVDVRQQALYVPLQCVFAEDGAHWVHVQTPAGGPQRRKVGIGVANDHYMEICAGLQDGDRVLLFNPLLPEAGGPRPEPGAAPGTATETAKPPAGAAKAGS